ncbi:MAG: type IV pilin protein [Halioglobus sp.]
MPGFDSLKTIRPVGFTLIELVIVIAILGLLFVLALPAYKNHQLKARRVLATGELMSVLARQEQFFANNKRYAPTLDLLGYSGSPYAINSKSESVAVVAADRIYSITLSFTAPAVFELTAVPQLGQTKDRLCGSLQLSSRGGKSTSTGARELCW